MLSGIHLPFPPTPITTAMQVRKAVITAAAPKDNRLPLQQLVDASGEDKTALQLIVEETVAAGVEEICVVIRPGECGPREQEA